MDATGVSRALDLLIGAFSDCGLDKESQRLKNAKSLPMWEIIDVLSRLENEVSHARAWKAVVLCKAAILGKYDEEAYGRYIQELQGLI